MSVTYRVNSSWESQDDSRNSAQEFFLQWISSGFVVWLSWVGCAILRNERDKQLELRYRNKKRENGSFE